MMKLLDELKRHTIVVADTGDLESMRRYRPQDATTNPSLITAASQMPAYSKIVDGALEHARLALGSSCNREALISHAIDVLSVEFGRRILEIVPGRVSTEVDARLSDDQEKTIEKAHVLIKLYEHHQIPRSRVLIKMASTWASIRAAEVLEKEGIHCNLTLLFGMHQAVACAEAGVTLISPFVGRILDFWTKRTGKTYSAEEDPGVLSVRRIYDYYKKFDYKTQVMGASFRNVEEILGLAGVDLVTVSPKLLAELDAREGAVERRLDPEVARTKDVCKLTIDEATFREMHRTDEMATFKLAEGIRGFSQAAVELEAVLAKRLLSV